MVTGTGGELLVSAVLENYADSSVPDGRGIRRTEVSDAAVNPEILPLVLPPRIIERLGLVRLGSRRARTRRGIVELGVFFPVLMWVQGRECLSEVTEWPDATRVLIGSLPLLMLDLVVDPTSGRSVGNPDHDGEQMLELY
jgi:hypothetical protein